MLYATVSACNSFCPNELFPPRGGLSDLRRNLKGSNNVEPQSSCRRNRVSLRFIKTPCFAARPIIAICGIYPCFGSARYLSVVPPSYMASTEILIDPASQGDPNDLTPRSENNESAIALPRARSARRSDRFAWRHRAAQFGA